MWSSHELLKGSQESACQAVHLVYPADEPGTSGHGLHPHHPHRTSQPTRTGLQILQDEFPHLTVARWCACSIEGDSVCRGVWREQADRRAVCWESLGCSGCFSWRLRARQHIPRWRHSYHLSHIRWMAYRELEGAFNIHQTKMFSAWTLEGTEHNICRRPKTIDVSTTVKSFFNLSCEPQGHCRTHPYASIPFSRQHVDTMFPPVAVLGQAWQRCPPWAAKLFVLFACSFAYCLVEWYQLGLSYYL